MNFSLVADWRSSMMYNVGICFLVQWLRVDAHQIHGYAPEVLRTR